VLKYPSLLGSFSIHWELQQSSRALRGRAGRENKERGGGKSGGRDEQERQRGDRGGKER